MHLHSAAKLSSYLTPSKRECVENRFHNADDVCNLASCVNASPHHLNVKETRELN